VSVITKKRIVKFAPRGQESFYDTVKQNVEDYFRQNNIKEGANTHMRVKTACMLSFYFVPLALILTGVGATSSLLFYALWIMMGFGIVGIGASVMHDSNHGSYSTNKHVNWLFGSVLNILGGYSRNWRIQHNVLHHTYTNLHGHDEDIAGTILIRMSPHAPKLKIHRFQHIYAWFLYSLMNLFWVFVKDYRLVFRYHKNDLLKKEKITLRKALIELTFFRIIYFSYILVLPIMLSGMPWYDVVLGFVMMQMVAGISLACIFQPAHVMETSEFPIPTDENKIENNWAAHQVLNTTNFAPNNKIVSWFIGGLNFQIEHHLFPHVCHVHYPKLSHIVKAAAEKYGLPYNVQPTVTKALVEHGRMLRILGRTA